METKDVGSNYDGIRRRVDGMLLLKAGIPKGVKNIITEIVVRRCEEFSLSAPELNRDLDSLNTFLNSVEFGKMLAGYERAAGLFCAADKRILLGQQYLGGLRRELFDDIEEQLSNWKAYETFTHELYHAMSKRPDGRDRMEHYSIYTGERMVNLLEMITEVSAIRSCGSITEESFLAGVRPCSGYSDLTFTLEAMAATFGMTEKEFLKAGMNGFSTLEGAILDSAGNKEVGKYFTDLDIIAEKMHSQLYPWGEQQKPTKEQLAKNITSDMKSFINISQEAIRHRLMYSDKPIEELSAELLYNHNKLENNYIHGINGFKWKLDQAQSNELSIHAKLQGMETRKLVRGLARVIENKESLGPVFYEQAIRDIRSGRILTDYKAFADMYGLETEKELNNPPPRIPDIYLEKIRKDDFSDGKVWNNKEILENVRGSVINNRFVHKIEDSVIHSGVVIRNSVRRLMNADRLMLSPAYSTKKLNDTLELPKLDDTEEIPILEDTVEIPKVKDTEVIQELEDTAEIPKVKETEVIQELEDTVKLPKVKDTELIKELEDTEEIVITENVVGEKNQEKELEFGELPPEQKRMAQEGYLNALRAIQTKEGGIENRNINKENKER